MFLLLGLNLSLGKSPLGVLSCEHILSCSLMRLHSLTALYLLIVRLAPKIHLAKDLNINCFICIEIESVE